LLESQVKKIASALGVSTTELLENMQAAGMLQAVMDDGTETGRIYIEQLHDEAQGLDAVRQNTSELIAEQETLNKSWDDFIEQVSPSAKAFREYGLTTEDVINYLAKAEGGVDAVIASLKEQGIVANDVRYYLDELGVSAEDVAKSVDKKRVAIDREKTSDEIAADKVADLRDELLYQSSAAGQLRLTTDDVTKALVAMGWTDDQIIDTLKALGNESDNVNSYLSLIGKTAEEVNDILENYLGTLDKVNKKSAEPPAMRTITNPITGKTSQIPTGVATWWELDPGHLKEVPHNRNWD